jgi:hypothetical protein
MSHRLELLPMAMGAVSVTGSATLIVAANTARHSILIGNNSSTVTLYVGDSTVTTSNGIPVPPGATLLEDSGGTTLWAGAIYGICASTVDTHYWERTRGV